MKKVDARPMGEKERGSALLVTIIMVTILLGVLSLLMVSMVNQTKHSGMGEMLNRAMTSAENGMAKGKAKVLANPSGYVGTDGFALIDTADNASVLISDEGSGAYSFYYRLESTGTHAGRSRTIQMLIEIRQATTPLNVLGNTFNSAVMSKGTIELNDDILISGNDHDKYGTYPGLGMHGPSMNLSGDAGSTVSVLDTDDVGLAAHNFVAPVWTSTPAGRVDTDAGLGSFWRSDGEDNDFDLVYDEADEFPRRPGHIFGFTDEQPLIDAAKGTNTYFTNFSDYEDWVNDVGTFMGSMGKKKKKGKKPDNQPSGKVIYVEIDNTGGPVSENHVHVPWADAANVTGALPTLLIFAGKNPLAHDVTITDLHVKGDKKFNGMIIADSVELKGSSHYIGSFFLFNDTNDSHLDDDNRIDYSSDVIGPDRLPGTPNPAAPWEYYVLMWREIQKY